MVYGTPKFEVTVSRIWQYFEYRVTVDRLTIRHIFGPSVKTHLLAGPGDIPETNGFGTFAMSPSKRQSFLTGKSG